MLLWFNLAAERLYSDWAAWLGLTPEEFVHLVSPYASRAREGSSFDAWFGLILEEFSSGMRPVPDGGQL